jgi:hypothetical protein
MRILILLHLKRGLTKVVTEEIVLQGNVVHLKGIVVQVGRHHNLMRSYQ